MAFVKQFLTKTQPSDNTAMFKYSPLLPAGELEIYALITISNDFEVETSRFNKFVWDGFLDGFLAKDDNIITRLKNALVGAEFKLKELIKHDNVLEEKGVNLDFSVLIFNQNKAFVGVLGDHRILFFKNKMMDLSDLLIKNKSNVGSTLMSPKDAFVVCSCGKDVKKELSELKEHVEIESYLKNTFEKEDVRGGAFFTTLLEEKVQQPEVIPVVKEKEEITDEEIEKKEYEVSVAEEDEEKSKWKETALLILSKLKLGFEKFIAFLSKKLSVLFEKLKSVLQNKYGRKRWFKKLQSASSAKRFSKGVRPFKVDGYKDKELRTRRFVTFFVILVLILAVFLGVRSSFESRQRNILSGELTELSEDWEGLIEKAERGALENSEESLNILTGVNSDLEKFLDDLEKEGRVDLLSEESLGKIENLKEKITEAQDKANRVVPISEDRGNIELFLDTKLALGEKSDPVEFVISKGSQIIGGEIIYVIDKGEKVIFEIPLRDGVPRRISDSRGLIKDPRYIDLGNNGLFVYDLESGALRAAEDSEGKYNDFQSISGLTSRSLGGEKVSAFAVFGPSDDLNFLISEDSRIIRSRGLGGVIYNLPYEYISHPSFEKGVDLFGDLYVYVLSTIPNGIKRFVPQTGLNSQLDVRGLKDDLRGIKLGFTGVTMDRAMVVFDSGTERFVRFTKPIENIPNPIHPNEIVVFAQYEYRGKRDDVFKDVKSVAFTDDDKFMYVLDGKKIWKINID